MNEFVAMAFGIASIVFLKMWIITRNENIQLKHDLRAQEKISGVIIPRGQRLTREEYPELFGVIKKMMDSEDA